MAAVNNKTASKNAPVLLDEVKFEEALKFACNILQVKSFFTKTNEKL